MKKKKVNLRVKYSMPKYFNKKIRIGLRKPDPGWIAKGPVNNSRKISIKPIKWFVEKSIEHFFIVFSWKCIIDGALLIAGLLDWF